MIKALNKFNQARNEIIELWFEGVDLNELAAVADYPFELSFDEYNVLDWVYNTIEELKKEL